MEYNAHIWASAPQSALGYLDKVQNRAIRLINDPSVTSTLAPLSHRRTVWSLTLFYRYLVGTNTCSKEIKLLMPPFKVFQRETRMASDAHPYIVEIPRWRNSAYGNDAQIMRTARIWNHIPPNVFPKVGYSYIYDKIKFKKNINIFLLNTPQNFSSIH